MPFGNRPNVDVREYQLLRTSNSFPAYQFVLRNASFVLPLIHGGRILQLSPMIIFYLGRLTNLFMYIALVFMAIKIIPSEKWKMIIMMIALFPMSMNLAATVSPDTVILGTSLLAIAYAMHLKFESKTITFKNIIIFGILCMIPTVCKVVYFPLCLLVFLFPKEKF